MANTNPLGVLLSSTNVASTIVQRDGSGNFAAGTITATLSGNASTATTLTSTLPVNLGGTGQTSYTNGQLMIGNTTGNTLTKASLTAGTGISITSGTGSITIAATGDQSVTLQDAYDNGTGAISTINAKPFKISSFTSNVASSPIIESTGNTFQLLACTDAGGDQKLWAWRASSAGELSGVLYNDSFGAPSPWIEVNRSGATPAIINFLGTSLQFNGDAIAKVNQIVVTSWDGSTTPVSVTAGNGISITGGTISADTDIDVDGASVNNGIGTTGATLVSSQSIRIGNVGTLTARIAFTATASTCDLLITPPFGATFTAGGQASGTGIVNKSSGAAIGDGTVSIIDSLAANGIKVDMVLATGSGSYTLYVSLQYTIAN